MHRWSGCSCRRNCRLFCPPCPMSCCNPRNPQVPTPSPPQTLRPENLHRQARKPEWDDRSFNPSRFKFRFEVFNLFNYSTWSGWPWSSPGGFLTRSMRVPGCFANLGHGPCGDGEGSVKSKTLSTPRLSDDARCMWGGPKIDTPESNLQSSKQQSRSPDLGMEAARIVGPKAIPLVCK